MNDIRKTKAQLIEELGEVRSQNDKLKKEQAAGKKSQEKFTRLFDNATAMAAMLDSKGLCREINRKLSLNLGFTEEEIINSSFLNLINPQERHYVEDIFKGLLEGKFESYEIEIKLQKKSGVTVWADLGISPLLNENNEPEGYIIVAADITDRKNTEIALRLSEERFRSIFNNASTMVIATDSAGKIIHANPLTFEKLGYSHTDLTGSSIYDITHPEDIDLTRENVEALISEESSRLNYEKRYIDKNGKIIWTEVFASSIHDEHGEITGLIGVIVDVTERKKAEEELRRSEERFRNLVETMNDGFGIQDENGVITYANERFCRMLGYEKKEMAGRKAVDFLDDENAEIMKKQTAKKDKEPGEQYEIVWKNKEGNDVYTLISPAVLRDESGYYQGSFAVITDITSQKIVQDKLENTVSLLNTTLESTDDGIYVVDLNNQVRTYNQKFINIWDIPEEFMNDRYNDRMLEFAADQVKNPQSFLEKVWELYHHPDMEAYDTIELKDERVIERYSAPHIMGDKIIGRVWSFRDITQRKWAEDELNKSLSQLEATLDSTDNGILVIDKDEKVLQYNKRFEEMWQIPQEILDKRDDKELIGYVIDQLEDPDEFFLKIRELYNTPDVQSYDTLYFKDGRIFERDSRSMKIGGEPAGRVWNFRDITEKKKNEIERENLLHSTQERMKKLQCILGITESAVQSETIEQILEEAVLRIPHGWKYPEITEAMIRYKGTVYTTENFFETPWRIASDLVINGVTEGRIEVFYTEEKPETDEGPFLKEERNILDGIAQTLSNSIERKKAEQALKQRNQFIETIINNLPIGLAVNDIDSGEVPYINEEFENIYGWSKEVMRDFDNFFEVVFPNPNYRELIKSRIMNDLASDAPERMKWDNIAITTSNGEERIVNASSIPLYEQNLMISTVQDVTDRYNAEEALRRSEERYRTVAENVPDTDLYLYDKDLRYTLTNGTEMLKHGLSKEYLEGKTLREALGDDVADILDFHYQSALEGKPSQTEVAFGEQYYFVKTVPIKNNQGVIDAGLAFVHNITEQKKAELELRRRLAIERFLIDVTGKFIGIYDFDDAVNKALADIGKFSKAGRTYLFQLRNNGEYMDNTHEWSTEGAAPQIAYLQNLPSNIFPWWMKKLRNEEVVNIPDVSLLPPEAKNEKEILESQDIKSVLVVPVKAGNELFGFIGFDNVTEPYKWNEEDLSLLNMFGWMLGNAIAKKHSEEILREKEENYRALFNSTGTATCVFGEDAVITQCNKKFEELSGLPREKIEGKIKWTDYVDENDLEKMKKYHEMRSKGESLPPAEYEFVLIDINGNRKNIYMQIAIMSSKMRIASLIDITDRKLMETAIKESEEKYRQLFNSESDAIVVAETNTGKIIDANIAALQLYGYNKEEILNKTVYQISDQPEETNTAVQQAITDKSISVPLRYHRKKNGEVFPAEISTGTFYYQGKLMLCDIVRDITDRKKAEDELKNSRQQLRDFAAHLQSVREEERAAIAREIHDEMGQMLSAFSMNLSLLIRDLKTKGSEVDFNDVLSEIESMQSLINITIQKVRQIVTELRPEVLEELTIIEAVEWLKEQLKKRNQIEVNFQREFSELDLDKESSIAVFRILQEALTNVIRHSKADKVDIKIRIENNSLLIEVKDNGIGFKTDSTEKDVKTFGLIGMKERAALCNGNVRILSEPGQGTKIIAEIPLK